MEVTAPVTDYIRGSLLTTPGDMIKRGAAVVERLPIGSREQVPMVNAGATDLIHRGSGYPLFLTKQTAENTVKTVTTAWLFIVGSPQYTYAENDILLVAVNIYGTKAGAAGMFRVRISKYSGTATIAFNHDTAVVYDGSYFTAGSAGGLTMMALVRVTGTGTLAIQLEAYSGGSNMGVANGDADIFVGHLYKV